MAQLYAVVERPPSAVWEVLADGWSYDRWVVGTAEILEVDPAWPRVGSSLRYRVGWGPLSFEDRTYVRIAEPPHRLDLEAHALPAGTARIAVNVIDWDDKTLILLDEHPLTGPGAIFHTAATDVVLRLRNRQMLKRLVRLTEERAPAGVRS